MSRSIHPLRRPWSACALVGGLVLGLVLPVSAALPAHGTDDGTCVGKGEYKAIVAGMSVQKVAAVLHDQVPFAEVAGKGKQRYRWYAACDAWQPEEDVYVRFHQPVVGRRTVTKKGLDVYVAP